MYNRVRSRFHRQRGLMRYLRVGPVLVLSALIAAHASGQTSLVEKNARAVLDAKCVGCHGAAHMSDLDLRQTASMLKGGKRGPAVTPGNAEASLLYQAVRGEGELKMPPGKTPLAAQE